MDLLEKIQKQARQKLKKIVLPEGAEDRVIHAACIVKEKGIAEPVLLGSKEEITAKGKKLNKDISEIEIIQPDLHADFQNFTEKYYQLRKHKGMTPEKASETLKNTLYFAAMLLREDQASGAVAGSINTTGDVLRAAIQIVGLKQNVNVVSSCFLMVMPDGKILTFADCAVMPDPEPEQLASIAISSARTHERLVGEVPRIAMLSFSTKGSASHPLVTRVVKATEIIRNTAPKLEVDGELQFDTAYVPEIGRRKAPDSPVAGNANVFIFPDLNAANIGYKMVQRLAGAEAVGPVIQGLNKPYNDLSRGCSVDDIVNVAAICSILSD